MVDNKKAFPLPTNIELIQEEKHLGLVKNPICRRFFTMFRVIGTLIMVCALVADYTYAFKQTFSSKELFVAYLSVLAFRCILPILIVIKNICTKVCNKENNRLDAAQYDVRDELESVYKKQQEHSRLGLLLYTVIPLTYFTGSYRLLNFKNFPSEIGCGLVIDFFFNALPLLFI